MSEHVDQGTGEITIKPYVPDDGDFYDKDFMEAIGLQTIGRDLVLSLPEFEGIQDAKIRYFWKRKGGKSGGADVMGKCQKPSGLTAFLAECDFVIWLAADHVQSWSMHDQLEPMVYHELCHAGFDVDEATGDVTYQVVAHEFEGFTGEMTRYGMWRDALRRVEMTVEQMKQTNLGI